MLFLCMQILYLDSLDVGDIVNNDLEVRAAAWTGQLVSKVCLMDKLSETQFGKLQVRFMHEYLFPSNFLHVWELVTL